MAEALRDIEVGLTGDLVLDSTGDLKLATPEQTMVQEVIFRVQTNFLEFGPAPGFGSNLIEFVGEANNDRNIQLIRQRVYQALTSDRRFRGHEINVVVFPANRETVGIVVDIIANFTGQAAERIQTAFVLRLGDGKVEAINI